MTRTIHTLFPIYYDMPAHREPALVRWFRRLRAKRGSGKTIPRREPLDGALVWQGGEALGARNGVPGGRMR